MSDVKVNIGGTEFTVYPANLGRVKRALPVIKRLQTTSGIDDLNEDIIEDIVALLEIILSRNNPEITRDFLEENLDLSNFRETLMTIIRGAGFTSQGERSPGEVVLN